jgi:Fe-S-cluster containining protein
MAGKEESDNNQSEQLPWYKDGLRFTCTGCGDCCSGAPGYVWVNKQEIAAMAAASELEVEAFESEYVRTVGIRKSLKEFPNGDCVFLDTETRGCTLYDARPRQCKTWPFWDSNLRTEEDWQRTCEECPGSGKGKLFQLDAIEEQRQKLRI